MAYSPHPQTPGDYDTNAHGGPVSHKNGLAIAALVLGILAILLFWTVIGGIGLGLIAVVLGILGKRKARNGAAPHGTMAVVGAVLGALGLIVSGVILALGVSVLNSDEFKSFDDCVKQADSQSQRDQCAEDFEQDVNNN
ncbi:DUF4190 domain-containing protein [Streptomyces sp. NPDC060194]|uniref:DUF4190 domain-containing protein n=1 Tax=Streptomyces sp. NPDC060194 TaxID=3347069 RepID=UPI00365E5D03